MMELKFEMKKEDYLAFNLYYVHQSETVKRSLLIQRFLGPIIFLSFALLFSWWTKESHCRNPHHIRCSFGSLDYLLSKIFLRPY